LRRSQGVRTICCALKKLNLQVLLSIRVFPADIRSDLFPTHRAKEIGRSPKAPAKFEQGGFTSRRRKDPKTLFPGASPENSFEAIGLANSRRIEYRARRYIAVYAAHHQREFGLPRLQKPQCCRWAAKSPRQLAAVSIQLNRLSATLRNRKSRNTLIRFDERSSSG
jgi:hypothetical protein